MSKVFELQESRAATVIAMRSLADTAETEKRDLTTDEEKKFGELKTALADFDKRISRATAVAEAERSAPAVLHGPRGDGDFETRAREFSVVKAIRATLGRDLGGDVDAGFEREISQEVARRSGRAVSGIAIPDQVFLAERRTLLAGSTAGDLIPNVHRADLWIDRLRASLVVEKLGATVLNDLVGTVDIPRQTGSSVAQWVAEDGALTETDPTFDDVTLAPKTVGAMTSYSRRTLISASPSIEMIVRNDLTAIIARAIDIAALTGPGTGNMPRGITATPGVTEIALAGAASWEEVLSFVAAVESNDALTGSLGWALNPFVVKKLRATPKVASTDSVMLMEEPGSLAGYPAVVTSALAGDTSPPVAGTVIFGAFDALLVGYWTGIDLLVNPYSDTAYARGRVMVRAMRDCDVQVRHPQSFAFADDMTVVAASARLSR
jgi:HK97 family phage major capsid protein